MNKTQSKNRVHKRAPTIKSLERRAAAVGHHGEARVFIVPAPDGNGIFYYAQPRSGVPARFALSETRAGLQRDTSDLMQSLRAYFSPSDARIAALLEARANYLKSGVYST